MLLKRFDRGKALITVDFEQAIEWFDVRKTVVGTIGVISQSLSALAAGCVNPPLQ